MSKKIWLILLLVSFTNAFSQAKIDSKLIDKKLTELQETTKTVGFSVAIVKNNEVIYSKGFGYADLEKKQKADANTLFAIGSSTKAFTVGLIGIMEAEKGLKFTDSPRKYIPELSFFNDELNNKVTINDMISHRTGLPRHDFSWYLFPSDSKDSLVARIKYQEPFTGLREKWYYNNFMYLSLGVITEKLTKKSWEENIEERFFKPLQMTRSNLNIKDLQNASNASKGYALEDFETSKLLPYYNIAAISPAGSINSSANEMANWVKIWLNEGKFNGTQVLPKSFVEKAINPLMLIGAGIADPKFPDQQLNSYGYAWFTSSYKGHYRVEHGGNIDGFSANVSFFPTDKIGIVVLVNQDGSALPSLARNMISDVVLNLNKTDWNAYYEEKIKLAKSQKTKNEADENAGTVPNTKPSHSLSEYTGKYHNKGYGTFTIEVKNDSLFAKFPREETYLNHRHYDVFKSYFLKDGKIDLKNKDGFNFNFQTNEMGDIASASLKIEPTLEPIIFERTTTNIQIKKEKLQTYIGTYSLSGTDLKVFLKGENLTLLVPGQPEYTLTPVKEDEFIIKGLSGYKAKFERTEKSFDLKLIQPNGVFTATKKD